jgi:hypothetical protein
MSYCSTCGLEKDGEGAGKFLSLTFDLTYIRIYLHILLHMLVDTLNRVETGQWRGVGCVGSVKHVPASRSIRMVPGWLPQP